MPTRQRQSKPNPVRTTIPAPAYPKHLPNRKWNLNLQLFHLNPNALGNIGDKNLGIKKQLLNTSFLYGRPIPLGTHYKRTLPQTNPTKERYASDEGFARRSGRKPRNSNIFNYLDVKK